mmetsp:Transcript_14240/g.41687  ORF Transcript_14240/g.41687 Transcript_14240/m.41687 type:complete len:391 (-) Transcript_14240:79-1251(-)
MGSHVAKGTCARPRAREQLVKAAHRVAVELEVLQVELGDGVVQLRRQWRQVSRPSAHLAVVVARELLRRRVLVAQLGPRALGTQLLRVQRGRKPREVVREQPNGLRARVHQVGHHARVDPPPCLRELVRVEIEPGARVARLAPPRRWRHPPRNLIDARVHAIGAANGVTQLFCGQITEVAPAERRRQTLIVARPEARDRLAHRQHAIEVAVARAAGDAPPLRPAERAERLTHEEGHVACVQRGRRLPERKRARRCRPRPREQRVGSVRVAAATCGGARALTGELLAGLQPRAGPVSVARDVVREPQSLGRAHQRLAQLGAARLAQVEEDERPRRARHCDARRRLVRARRALDRTQVGRTRDDEGRRRTQVGRARVEPAAKRVVRQRRSGA